MRRVDPVLSAAIALLAGAGPTSGQGFDRAIESVSPRVVKLYGMGAGLSAGFGTGVVVSEDGLILTVFSLLIDARRIKAVTADGTTYAAEVVYRDVEQQLALLRLKPWDQAEEDTRDDQLPPRVGPFAFFDLSREAALAPGDWVVTAGNAFKVAEGAEPMSLAHGVFSIRTRLDARRNLKDFPYRGDVLVIDAITSNPGAPGSAVVNLDGEFVGMVGRVVTSNRTHTHFNYAIPRDVLYDLAVEAAEPAESADGERLHRRKDRIPAADIASRIGIRLAQLGYRKRLPFVEQVRGGSPADRAGIRQDDLIQSVNGTTIQDVAEWESKLGTIAPTEPIDLVIRRGRTILTVQIPPEKGP